MKDFGGSAFPSEQHETQDNTWNQTFDPGMSLRDYFAAAALQGLLAASATNWNVAQRVAKAFEVADAMLIERAKP